ncbi:uncharacterized protein LOC130761805 isoform X2 [Actinidia eriantha]|uniref:uncharacterized protein LOC130761805 isoform X1 n=1 Tax=Actinidia eriantha TaxID=165200 RepID=UPI002587CA27|nr:uncharacterized protein LOC130761805 isoform X1 [Actinidia eriantha]XP_057473354.1 uncharacterized protein LOC130761805 isoform X2 [Actinidia eriantha]
MMIMGARSTYLMSQFELKMANEGEASHIPVSVEEEQEQEIEQERVNQPNPTDKMMEAIVRLTEQNARLLELQAAQMGRQTTSLIKQFQDLGAKEFMGTLNPTEAENWLKDAVRILDRMGVTEDERVDLEDVGVRIVRDGSSERLEDF